MESISAYLSSLLAVQEGSSGVLQGLIAVVIAYFGGILSSLTPCVYPMIPITVSVVGGMPVTREAEVQRTGRAWREILLRGAAYVFGMTIIYSFLGVAAGLTGRVFGTLTNTSGWYLSLGVIISVSALIMLEVIPFDPQAWWSKLQRKLFHSKRKAHPVHPVATHREMTLAGAFTLGASSGFIAAPCTTPVLTAILAYIAKTQSIGLGLALMISFSLGLGTLLVLIAAFTGALQLLPRSGNWMKLIKIASGIILLGFGEYLIYRAGALGGP